MASTKVNYNDKRFANVEKKEKQAITENEQLYGGMIKGAETYYNKQINESKRYAKEQSKIQQQQTDFAIQQVEQQKAQAKKDYTREQSGAYVDWQKQSNQYGANAEQRASAGLQNTGYSESSQVSMYNTYQNRVATARESYNTAVQNYNNSITQARLQNNATLAEIAHNALQKQLELSLQGYQYKNQLLLDKADKKLQIKNTYYSQWKDVLDQINTENSLAEQKRQFNAEQAMKKAQLAEDRRQFNANLAENRRQFNVTQANKSKAVKISESGNSNNTKIQQLANGSYVITNGANITDKKLYVDGDKLKPINRPYTKNGKQYYETPYYNGEVNPDAKYGTFSNRYQPDGVTDKNGVYSKLIKVPDTIFKNYTTTTKGKKVVVTQSVWQDRYGRKYYWDGKTFKYRQL